MSLETSKEIKDIMYLATVEAEIHNHKRLKVEHIAMAIISQDINIATMTMFIHGVDLDYLYDELTGLIVGDLQPNYPIGGKKELLPTKETKNVLLKSEMEAMFFNSKRITTRHLLLGLLSVNSEVKNIFNKCGIDVVFIKEYFTLNNDAEILNDYNKINLKYINMSLNKEEDSSENARPIIEPRVRNRNVSKTPILDEFCRDVTQMGTDGLLQPAYGREKEVQRMVQILCRKNKRNPILVGHAGVGKSVIVDGLAIMIANGVAPKPLLDKKIYSLEIASLIAGTKYRGQFEERMKGILGELKQNPNIIIFIDEIHTMVGAGSTSGSLDVSNILKPALARGEMQLIGATTFDEYRENIEKDGALARRLQKVTIVEPNLAETKVILMNIKEIYEEYHNVNYTEEVIDACVNLSDRYIQDRAMPDKAIDILDECGSLAKLSAASKSPKDILKLETAIEALRTNELNEIETEKLTAISMQDFEKASKVRDLEKKILIKIEKLQKEVDNKIKNFKVVIDMDIVNSVVSTMTMVPVEKLSTNDNKNLFNMNEQIKDKVIGQDEAVDKICKAIIRSKVGIKNPNKPLSFMLLGQSGVGKTQLTKEIAMQIFGNKESLIRVDMSEYMEKFNMSTLVGAPPGYIGYGEGGKLTEAVRQKPYSVVLFDEIEKAHPDVFNLMLQILDEGHITDGNGRKINFKNTLIVMTSNIGVKELSVSGSGLGFQTTPSHNNDRDQEIIKKALKAKFAPEFLNRIGSTIVFNKLTLDNIKKIVANELVFLEKRVKELGFTLQVKPNLIEYLAEIGFDPEYGARPLGRAIETTIEDAVAEEIIKGSLSEGGTIIMDYSKDKKEVVVNLV